MKSKLLFLAAPAMFMACILATAQARPAGGKVLVPDSSIERTADIGRFAHTNVRVFAPTFAPLTKQVVGPPYAGYAYETPASLACVYGLVSWLRGVVRIKLPPSLRAEAE